MHNDIQVYYRLADPRSWKRLMIGMPVLMGGIAIAVFTGWLWLGHPAQMAPHAWLAQPLIIPSLAYIGVLLDAFALVLAWMVGLIAFGIGDAIVTRLRSRERQNLESSQTIERIPLMARMARVWRWFDVNVLPILLGTAIIALSAWVLALVGWLLPIVNYAYAKPPWFHDPKTFAALSGIGLVTILGSAIITFVFLAITFCVGHAALGRGWGDDDRGSDKPE